MRDTRGYETRRGRDISGHGFRALARTLLREKLKLDRKEIERHLAHKSDEELGDTYDKARFIGQRRQMSQVWADWLDNLAGNRLRPDLTLVAAA